jgi:hypothetical protein
MDSNGTIRTKSTSLLRQHFAIVVIGPTNTTSMTKVPQGDVATKTTSDVTPLLACLPLLTHSDQFNPEMMQGTRAITFTNCGRRFKLLGGPNTVSGRQQNWYDADGSVTGLGGRSIAASGLAGAGLWWKIDGEGMYSLWFRATNNRKF